MFEKILVANRGEVALRIMRAARELGVKTVAVYSTEDADTYPVRYADEAVCIGPAQSNKSYLVMASIIAAAKNTGAEAIHPGYGFLAENAEFARACADNDLVFIGPAPECIDRMGDKSSARETMKMCGVPTVPGSDGCLDTVEEAAAFAEKVGYPVLIKASAGGGGRGMRRVYEPEQLIPLFEEARSESLACFGSGEMYLEKLIVNPRHIEFQIMADGQGHVIQLGDRDCSIQRRNQKLLEESPSKALTPELRERMGAAAVAAARAAGYVNAGTIEFVLAPDGQFYFIEMNTRIQVEHPVTELVTGLDLVREQLRIAAGLPLSLTQEEVSLTGHAIECRVNAEDAAAGFRPCPGTTEFLHFPGGPGVRVDSMLYNGYAVSPYYDSLVAKIIVHAPTRLEAIRRMRRALEELVIQGYPTTADFCHLILHHPDFIKGQYDTGFLAAHQEELLNWDKEE